MITYETLSREKVGLTVDEWKDLRQFVEEIQPIIQQETENEPIESSPPHFVDNDSSKVTRFSPGGWAGRYPGGITVRPRPDKLNRYEYEFLLSELAGWIELWDLPTAMNVLPLVQSKALERRRILLGYSNALIEFSEEAVANRPPVAINRERRVDSNPGGTLDINRTVQERATGSRSIAYYDLQFSFNHPLNLLLLRFHIELSQELDQLIDDSVLTESAVRKNKEYHQQFVESRFSPELVDKALQLDFSDPSLIAQAQRESPTQLAEIIDLWEAYQAEQALGVSIEQQLTIGIKPVEKLYELWGLTIILDCLKDLTGLEPTRPGDELRTFEFTPKITLHYNRSLEEYSRILSPRFNSNPGRPDYAISVGNDIVWIGDAKYSLADNIGLEDYQRLLSYTVDLMPAHGKATATILYVGERTTPTTASSSGYTIEQTPLRPKEHEEQISVIKEQLSRSLPESVVEHRLSESSP
ncbi:hypothetical protein K0C01_05050 [Salinarchaeum sp. IM2453]|uniref:hypothetical protein n=1 Tax=Salinarchaeum sp. IM2453 TaxID=2862870 RepID=UPI001C82FDA2|nr:hypothetical protein [Salinarchaeum sp. IM2453]QZA89505.1 hypothetical protein K0C01_05050 [Salinarchaeum sp. IM2453]